MAGWGHAVRQERLVIIVLVLTAALTAAVVGRIVPASSQAEARIIVNSDDPAAELLGMSSGGQTDRDVLMDTHVRLAGSREVAEAVRKQLGIDITADALLKRVTVTAEGRSRLLVITAKGSTPRAAADIANTWADAYVDISAARQADEASATAAKLTRQVRVARDELTAVDAKIKASGEDAESTARRNAAASEYERLLAAQATLAMQQNVRSEALVVVGRAVPEEPPSLPVTITLDVLRGALLGSLLAAAVVFIRHRRELAARTSAAQQATTRIA